MTNLLRQITPQDQFILDQDTGNLLGIRNPRANGADLLFNPANVAITGGTITGITGVIDASNAAASSVGEFITATGTDVALTTATPANITSVVLTAGDWEVTGSCIFTGTGTTATSIVRAGSSTVSATLPAAPMFFRQRYGAAGGFTGADVAGHTIPTQRVNVSVTTTVYLVAEASFTTSTETATGQLSARRIR